MADAEPTRARRSIFGRRPKPAPPATTSGSDDGVERVAGGQQLTDSESDESGGEGEAAAAVVATAVTPPSKAKARPRPSRAEASSRAPNNNRRVTPIADFAGDAMTPELARLLAATTLPPALQTPEAAEASVAADGGGSGDAALVASVRQGSLASHGW